MNLTVRHEQGNGFPERLPLRAENHKDSTCTVCSPGGGQNGSYQWIQPPFQLAEAARSSPARERSACAI